MPNQILSMEERINLSIEIGESHFREFKSALEGPPGGKTTRNYKEVCQDIAKTLVAFANADGGELLIGVEDDGTITGISYQEQIIEKILEAPKTHVHHKTPLPTPKKKRLTLQGKTILYFSIQQGNDYCYLTSDGKCLQRRDLESVPVPSEHIKASRNEYISKKYDRDFVEKATIDDLDMPTLQVVANQISHGMSPEKCLQYLDLAEFDGERLKLKQAALLLFSKDIIKWHPRCQVRILKIKGKSLKTGEDFNVEYDDEVRDNIFKLLEKSWESLRPNLTETRMTDSARFQTQIIYPELACREALTNAIAHRDYSNEGRCIEIEIYEDRIEIKNPGGLLSSISISDLLKLEGIHQSRNTLISRSLRETGYMRELGEGIRRIFNLMNSNDLADPVIDSSDSIFKITLHQKYIYTKEEKLWLNNFESFDLDRNQKTIVRLGYGGKLFSTKQILDACGIVDIEDFRKIISSLYEMNILINTIPNKSYLQQLVRQTSTPRNQIKKFQILLPS